MTTDSTLKLCDLILTHRYKPVGDALNGAIELFKGDLSGGDVVLRHMCGEALKLLEHWKYVDDNEIGKAEWVTCRFGAIGLDKTFPWKS